MGVSTKIKSVFASKQGWSTEPVERMSYYSYFAGQNMIYTLFNSCLATYLLFLGIHPIKSAAVIFAVKVWDAVMSRVHDDKVIANMKEGDKYLEFNVSNNLVECTYCRDSGLLMSEACSHDPRGNRAETGWFVKGTEPTEYCQTHIMVDYDFVEKAIACEWCPPENIKQVALLDVERRFEKQVAVVDAQYVYMELPFDDLPYQTVYRPYFYNLGNGEYYCGYTYGPVHYNRTCSAHFDKNAWQDKVAGILAGETTAAETTLTTPPEDQRRRLDEILGGQ